MSATLSTAALLPLLLLGVTPPEHQRVQRDLGGLEAAIETPGTWAADAVAEGARAATVRGPADHLLQIRRLDLTRSLASVQRGLVATALGRGWTVKREGHLQMGQRAARVVVLEVHDVTGGSQDVAVYWTQGLGRLYQLVFAAPSRQLDLHAVEAIATSPVIL